MLLEAIVLTTAAVGGPSTPNLDVAMAAGDSTAELVTRMADIERRLEALEAASDHGRLSRRRAEEIRSLIHDVLTDAETRTSLLQGGLTAGWDRGFFITSADGNFLLRVAAQLQVRFVYNSQENSPQDDSRWGFENRRVKLKTKGHIVDPTWKYRIAAELDRSTGNFVTEDATIAKTFGDRWAVMVGQFKLPFLREESVSSTKQLLVERSLVNEAYNQDRTLGAQVAYTTERWRVRGAISNGFKTRNAPALSEDTEVAITGRVDVLLDGTWKQFDDFTSPPGSRNAWLLGAAAHYEQSEAGTSTPRTERATWTVDLSGEFDGVGFFAAVVANHLASDAAGVADRDQIGVVVQGSYYLTDDWEGFLRYAWSDFDESAVEDLGVVTFGVNRYWNRHAMKWTTDIGLALDEVSAPFAASGAGWRVDTPGEDGQVVVRSQLQLLF